MDNTVYIALSRQVGLLRDMETTANNLANQNTVGYKSTKLLFEKFLVDDGKKHDMSFANDISSFDNHIKGSTQVTGNALDLSIGGKGYFMVETPAGTRYTRAGSFQLASDGTLITATGYPVLDTGGQHIQFTEEDRDITIGGMGNITVNGEDRGSLGIVEFDNEYLLKRVGNQMYASDDEAIPAVDPRVAQGALESSNVETVHELTHMIDVTRSAGSTAKMIDSMYDLHRRTNQIYTQQS
jgi:flagellar basal-body rod protein FlgF